MIQVVLRILVWLLVFGIGYLVFGPTLFDSSDGVNPFENPATIYLPAEKTEQQLAYEKLIDERQLTPEESADYLSLVRERESGFWRQEGVSVEQALADVTQGRKARLVEILEQRGLSREEMAVFFAVVERDNPTLLEDRE